MHTLDDLYMAQYEAAFRESNSEEENVLSEASSTKIQYREKGGSYVQKGTVSDVYGDPEMFDVWDAKKTKWVAATEFLKSRGLEETWSPEARDAAAKARRGGPSTQRAVEQPTAPLAPPQQQGGPGGPTSPQAQGMSWGQKAALGAAGLGAAALGGYALYKGMQGGHVPQMMTGQAGNPILHGVQRVNLPVSGGKYTLPYAHSEIGTNARVAGELVNVYANSKNPRNWGINPDYKPVKMPGVRESYDDIYYQEGIREALLESLDNDWAELYLIESVLQEGVVEWVKDKIRGIKRWAQDRADKKKEANIAKARSGYAMAKQSMRDGVPYHPIPASVYASADAEFESFAQAKKVKDWTDGWNFHADWFNKWINTAEGEKWNDEQAAKWRKLNGDTGKKGK